MKKSSVIVGGVLALSLLMWWCVAHHLPLMPHPVGANLPANMAPASPVVSLDISAEVQTQAQLQAQAPTQTLSQENKLILQGAVANAAVKAQILQQAAARYGSQNVVDKLSINPTTHALDAKLLEAFPPKIEGIAEAVYRLTSTPLALGLNGKVANTTLKAEIAKKLSDELGPSWQILNQLEAPSAEIVAANQTIRQTLALESIQFASGSAVILMRSKVNLNRIAQAFKSAGARSLLITGHTDNTGAEPPNITLSQARADAVKKYLATQGVALAAMSAQGLGSSQAVGDNKTAAGRHANRRIDFTIQ